MKIEQVLSIEGVQVNKLDNNVNGLNIYVDSKWNETLYIYNEDFELITVLELEPCGGEGGGISSVKVKV